MKKYLFLLFLPFLVPCIAQQDMDFARVIPPSGTMPRVFEDYLVQLAWYNSPGNLIFKKQVDIAAQKAKLTYWEWLKDANVSFNLNEGNLSNSALADENIYFPRYNFGLTLNLGAIASRPTETRIAKEEIQIARLEEQQQMLAIRAEVLRRYQDYELAVTLLKSKTQAAQEAATVYSLVSDQFEMERSIIRILSAPLPFFTMLMKPSRLLRQRSINPLSPWKK